MAYSALTAFMDISPSAEDYAKQAARQWAGKSEAELEALLIPEFAEFVRVKQENEELADLRRQVKNLEWRLKKDLVQPQPSPDQPLCDHPVSEIEQHLHQRVAELERALAPFADVFNGEGDSDYGDDEDVVLRCGRVGYFALTLGDFRRAAAAFRIQE